MTAIGPLIVAVPLLAAAIVAGTGKWLASWIADAAGVAAAAASVTLAAILTIRVGDRTETYWFGGWRPPANHFPVGISWTADRVGAGLALFAFVLLLAALVYSWRYLEEKHYLFVALMLVFGAAMGGFALTGDLFNMFVLFELMSVCAYALGAYNIEEPSPLQGSFNFGVVNTIGALLVLVGIALVYDKTGSLNLADIGARLANEHGHRSGIVVVAFALIVCGFLVKAAAVPFQFWLADAYAVATAPVCLLFAAVMSDLGIYAIARIYWTMFDGVFATFDHPIRDILLGVGAVTAVLGAVMAGMQRHIKRLLAYATIADLGCIFMGVAVVSPDGIAGSAMFVLEHGLAKGALFLVGGLLLVELGEIDELLLRGRGRRMWPSAVAWGLASLALASPPFLGTFTGHALIEDSASTLGYWWVAPVIAFSTIGSTGAIIRVGLRVFLGIGDRDDPLLSDEPRESPPPRENPQLVAMRTVTLVLAAGGLALGAVTPLAARLRDAAHVFTDRAGYVSVVLDHHAPVLPPHEPWVTTSSSVAWSIVTLVGSIVIGYASLYRARLPQRVSGALAAGLRPLRAAHSGHVGDYVAWLTFGTAVIGGLFAVTMR